MVEDETGTTEQVGQDKAGIIEKGYAKASLRRGHTAVRVPWKPKGAT